MKKTGEKFDLRNEEKKKIEFGKEIFHNARIGQLRWYREGINIGKEISKDGAFKRVCLIIHNKLGNGLVLVAPITTKYHYWMKDWYYEIKDYNKLGLRKSWIILNQIKLIDKKRLSHRIDLNNSLLGLVSKIKYMFFERLQKS